MNIKYTFIIFITLFFLSFAHKSNNLLNEVHGKRRLSHIHPRFRRLSQNGMLDIKINGKGFFMFRDRVTDKTQNLDYLNHESMAGSPNHYHSAYIARI
mgnify:CR=1 FL=1